MKGKVILLIAATVLACGNATPYSKISDNDYQLKSGARSYAQAGSAAGAFGQSFSAASASASANAYAGSNYNGQEVGYGSGQDNNLRADSINAKINASGDYWWNNNNSPFSGHQGYVSSANEVSGGASYASKNPFLAGSQYTVGGGQEGSFSGTYHHGSNAGANANSYATSNYGAGDKQSTNVFLNQGSNQQNIGSGYTVCSGKGKICVARHLCSNGYVSDGVQGLTQVRQDNQQCDDSREVCCTMRDVNTYNHGTSGNRDQDFAGSIFQNSYDRDYDLNAGDAQKTVSVDRINGYLPPEGEPPSAPTDTKITILDPPRPPVITTTTTTTRRPITTTYRPIVEETNFVPTHVQLGCAAALICVEEQYCTMTGMISDTPLSLTEEQLLRRVPMTDCKNPETGVIGKCCRDPNYVDPWPTGNLPANYTGGFDEQGFPTFLNIQKTRPTKKPVSNTPIKPNAGRFPQKTVTIQTPRPNYPAPTQGYTTVGSYRPSSTVAPSVVISTQAPINKQSPYYPNVPSTPVYPRPFVKPNYDESPSNSNPIVVQPYRPGNNCGRRNSDAQRLSGLTDVDVAFGEITWEAMILSNKEKKLLCSGAIVAPNAVLTAAHCVDGYRADEVSIKAGEWKLGYELKHEEPLPFEIVQVSQIVQHPGYLPGSQAHDLVVLLLEHDIHYDDHVGPICMRPDAYQTYIIPESHCISTGWGKHILQAHLAGATMHSIDVDIINERECRQRINNAENRIEIDDSLICTKVTKQQNNMCQVDMGGPLACDRGDGIYELVGVYNQDTGCIPTNQVATFAKIDVPWVEYVIANPPQIKKDIYSQPDVQQTYNPSADDRQTYETPDDRQTYEVPQVNQPYGPPKVQPTYNPPTSYNPSTVRPTYNPPSTYNPSTVRPTYNPSTPRPTYNPSTVRPTYGPPKVQPTYTPSTVGPTYGPPRVQPTYTPSTVQPTYGPPKVQPTYTPSTVGPTYGPSKVQPTYTPSTVGPTYGPPEVQQPYNPPPQVQQPPYNPPQQSYTPQQPQPNQPNYYQNNQQPCDCQHSNLPPYDNQYLPPV